MGIGRMNVTIPRAGTLTQIGLVVGAEYDPGATFYYMNGIGFSDSSMFSETTGFELLSC